MECLLAHTPPGIYGVEYMQPMLLQREEGRVTSSFTLSGECLEPVRWSSSGADMEGMLRRLEECSSSSGSGCYYEEEEEDSYYEEEDSPAASPSPVAAYRRPLFRALDNLHYLCLGLVAGDGEEPIRWDLMEEVNVDPIGTPSAWDDGDLVRISTPFASPSGWDLDTCEHLHTPWTARLRDDLAGRQFMELYGRVIDAAVHGERLRRRLFSPDPEEECVDRSLSSLDWCVDPDGVGDLYSEDSDVDWSANGSYGVPASCRKMEQAVADGAAVVSPARGDAEEPADDDGVAEGELVGTAAPPEPKAPVGGVVERFIAALGRFLRRCIPCAT